MFDAPPFRAQRVRGGAHVALGRLGLRDLHQQGSAKAMLPRTDDPDPEVVFLNTSGGVTDGDALSYRLDLGAGARATGATQTAERAYRASGTTPGHIHTAITLGAGAHLDWLPQDLIAFDGCNIRRETEIDLEDGATLLMVDSLVLGRAAHGERVQTGRIEDLRTIRRAGRLLHQEHLALDPRSFTTPAALGPNRAFATLVVVRADVADLLGPLRRALGGAGHASLLPGRLVVRLAAPEAAPLRRALIHAILTVRGRDVPRVWQSDA